MTDIVNKIHFRKIAYKILDDLNINIVKLIYGPKVAIKLLLYYVNDITLLNFLKYSSGKSS